MAKWPWHNTGGSEPLGLGRGHWHKQKVSHMVSLRTKTELLLRGNMSAAAAAKSLQSCPTLCNPIDDSPPGSAIPGILQARTLEWVAISFSNAWKWKVMWSHSVISDSLKPHGLQPTRLLCPWGFPGKSSGAGYHCLLQYGCRGEILVNPSFIPGGSPELSFDR